MPITPFHFGPGAALKALAPARFSFTVFVLSQLVIDLEPVLFFLASGEPLHPYLHTYAGASAVALASLWPGRRLCEWALRAWNSRLSEAQARWMSVPAAIEPRAALAGAFLGAWSHVFIDSFMHADVRPLAPFSRAGQMTGLVDIDLLHWICAAAGAAGLAALAFYRFVLQRNQSQASR